MNVLEWIQANYYYFMAVYGVFLVILVIYLALFRHRNKIQIRIKTPLKEFRVWRKPEPDGKTIVMEKGKKRPLWRFTYTQKAVILFTSWFRERKAIAVFYHGSKAVNWDYEAKKIDQYPLTKGQVKEYANMEAVKQRYSKFPKLPLPNIFWIVVILGIINVVLAFLNLQGKITP